MSSTVINAKTSKKCAICKNWYDPTNSAIEPKLHIPLELHADSDCICMTVSNGTACLSDLNCIYF